MTARDDVLRNSEVDIGPRIARIAPAVAALLFPVALHALYGAGRLVHEATSLESALSVWAITFGVAALAYSVPAIALWANQALGQERHPPTPTFPVRSRSCIRSSGVRKPCRAQELYPGGHHTAC